MSDSKRKIDAVDLGLPIEEESIFLALDIHLEFLKFLNERNLQNEKSKKEKKHPRQLERNRR
jgi:hypothetical protein|tara:strand:- start:1338 stop:1523 length:186 start_codon:yes stop_codon:yes gene_type:complete